MFSAKNVSNNIFRVLMWTFHNEQWSEILIAWFYLFIILKLW